MPTRNDLLIGLYVWLPVTILAGVQGWLTGDSVMIVLHWLGH